MRCGLLASGMTVFFVKKQCKKKVLTHLPISLLSCLLPLLPRFAWGLGGVCAGGLTAVFKVLATDRAATVLVLLHPSAHRA